VHCCFKIFLDGTEENSYKLTELKVQGADEFEAYRI
jgi:hypothetical protein